MVKPDQLIKRRGKLGLIKVNANFGEVKQVKEFRCTEVVDSGGSE